MLLVEQRPDDKGRYPGGHPAEISQEKVFERFFQASPTTEGSGIGPAKCRRTVDDLGGRIGIESENRDRGVTVTVALPLRRTAQCEA